MNEAAIAENEPVHQDMEITEDLDSDSDSVQENHQLHMNFIEHIDQIPWDWAQSSGIDLVGLIFQTESNFEPLLIWPQGTDLVEFIQQNDNPIK